MLISIPQLYQSYVRPPGNEANLAGLVYSSNKNYWLETSVCGRLGTSQQSHLEQVSVDAWEHNSKVPCTTKFFGDVVANKDCIKEYSGTSE